MTSTSFTRDGLTFNYDSSADISVTMGSDAGDALTVQSVAAGQSVNILAGAAGQSLQVGDATNALSQIAGTLTLTGNASPLVFDDSANASAVTTTISPTSGSVTPSVGATPIGFTGADSLTFGGGSGYATVLIDDQSNATNTTYTVTSSGISIGSNNVNVNNAGALEVETGTGADTVNIESTFGPTTITAGAAGQTFNVGATCTNSARLPTRSRLMVVRASSTLTIRAMQRRPATHLRPRRLCPAAAPCVQLQRDRDDERLHRIGQQFVRLAGLWR